MRSLEFEASKRSPFVRVGRNLLGAMGQEAHKLPNVFSFFKPEYRPPGQIAAASLVAPESQGKAKVLDFLAFLFFVTSMTET